MSRYSPNRLPFESLLRGYQVARVIGNDGTYYASIPELSIDAAVLPKVFDHILETLRPSSRLTDTQVLLYDLTTCPELLPSYRFLTRAFTRWRADSQHLLNDLNGEIIPFLTSSSSSSPVELLTSIQHSSKTIKNALGRRIVTFVYELSEVSNLSTFRTRLSEHVKAVERTQISRRPRAIAGVNNPRILASLTFLRAAEILQKIVRYASSGKQKGNANDLVRMLYLTSRHDCLHSSMDVSGFDASVQAVSQTHFFISMISEVLGPDCHSRYLGYAPVPDPNNVSGNQTISALSLLASDVMIRLQPQSTVVKGRVVDYVYTADPTFPSGLAFTTAHHTIRLGAGIMGEACERMETGGGVTSLQDIGVQGDYIHMTFCGSDSRTEADLHHAQTAINNLGFETVSESSKSTIEFLQQRVILGRPALYPDRVSLMDIVTYGYS